MLLYQMLDKQLIKKRFETISLRKNKNVARINAVKKFCKTKVTLRLVQFLSSQKPAKKKQRHRIIYLIAARTTNMKPYPGSEHLKHKLITYVANAFISSLNMYLYSYSLVSFKIRKHLAFQNTLFSLGYTETICWKLQNYL